MFLINNKLTLNMAGNSNHNIISTVIILTFLIKLVYITIQYHNYVFNRDCRVIFEIGCPGEIGWLLAQTVTLISE